MLTLNGVRDLMSAGARDRWLDKIDVGELWSIGRASESKLLAIGIVTVAQLRNLDTRIARKMLSVVGDQIILELRGVPCLALEHVPAAQGLRSRGPSDHQ